MTNLFRLGGSDDPISRKGKSWKRFLSFLGPSNTGNGLYQVVEDGMIRRLVVGSMDTHYLHCERNGSQSPHSTDDQVDKTIRRDGTND